MKSEVLVAMSWSERLSQKHLYHYTKRHRVTFTTIIIFCSGFPTKIWYAFLTYVVCPRPYPLLLTNKANIIFAFVGKFVPSVLLEGTPFRRRVGCNGTVDRRPGIAVDAARFCCLLSQNVWILRHAVGKAGPSQITQ